jgi:hypothetical protein
MLRFVLPLALLFALPACKEDSDPDDTDTPEGDTDTDTDADTDTDTDGDTDVVGEGTDLGELADGWLGVDPNLGPFDQLNSEVTCSGGAWDMTMLDADGAADEGWVVGWDMVTNERTGAFPMTFDSGSHYWEIHLTTAQLGLDCDQAGTTIIFFLPVAADMLGMKAATVEGSCTGAGFGIWDVDQYMLNASTNREVDSATVRGFQVFTEASFGPLDMDPLSADTWNLLYTWKGADLSIFGQEVLLAYAFIDGGSVVGVGGW